MATISTTANVSLGTAGTLALVKWVFGCLANHHFAMPDDTTLTFMCAYLMPFGHLIYIGFASWFAKTTGVPLPEAPPVPLAAQQ